MVAQVNTDPRKAFEGALRMFQSGDFSGAERHLNLALHTHANDPNLLRLLGASLMKQSRYAEAQRHFIHVTRLVPNYAPGHENLGECYLLQGKVEEAIEALKIAARHDPASTSISTRLGELLSLVGRGDESDQVFETTMENNPNRAALVEAMEHARNGDDQAAERAYRKVLRTNAEDVDALRMLGVLKAKNEQFNDAEALFRRAVELAPDYWTAWVNLGTALNEQQKFDKAEQALRRALQIKPGNVHTLERLGANCMNDGRLEESVDWLQQALDQDENHFPALLCLGHALKTIGKQQEAIDAYRRCAVSKPDFGEVYWSLANLKTFRFGDDELDEMHRQLAIVTDDDPNVDSEISFSFAIGKAYEDRKDYKRAFEFYQRGNEQKRLNTQYDPIEMEVQIDRLIDVFTADYFAQRQGQGNPDPSPILIVGLPRSGSTLLEQILASHSEVEGTAELHYLLRIASETGATRADGIKYPQSMLEQGPHQLHGLGEEYLEEAQIHRTDKPYFTDKLPNNFTGIGFLHSILPNAKVIDARRHPLDSCLGSYKQLFAKGQPFSYDLYDLAHYYIQYVRIMEHWDSVLPGKVLRVQYEDVVSDLDSQARRIAAHCGLDWEDAMLRFHETKRAVKTASSEQVRQPIYSGSVNLWRHYEDDLAELIDFLEPVLMDMPAEARPKILSQ
ncbi:MAG: sulfotransferase [Pseudomonadota bacterium]